MLSASKKFLIKLSCPAPSACPWLSALPSGNGRSGILVQGGVRYERIMLSSSKSYWQGNVGVLPDISDKIKEVRKQMSAKNPTVASTIMSQQLEKRNYKPAQAVPLPLLDIAIEQNIGTKPIAAYSRTLDMASGEIVVLFNDSGNKYERKVFVSKHTGLVVYEISKISGTKPLSVDLSLVQHDIKTSCFENEATKPFAKVESKYENGFMFFAFDSGSQIAGGAVSRVLVDPKASLHASSSGIRIENAEKIVVLVAPFVGKKEKFWVNLKNDLLTLKNVSYAKMFSDHLKLFEKEWGNTELSIANEKEGFVDNILTDFKVNKSKLIYEKLFHFARFLMICGSTRDMFSFNPSALWSFYYKNTKAVADISGSIPAYFSAVSRLGLIDKMNIVFDYYEKYIDDLKKNAARLYDAKGYMVPRLVAEGSALPASILPADLSFVAGGAILANMYFEYFEYTKDTKFLKNRAIPFMQEVAKFYLTYFKVDANGEVRSCPSFSPNGVSKQFENRPLGIYENCSCDFILVRSLLTNLFKAASKFGISLENETEFHTLFDKLPPLKLENGSVAEFQNGESSLKSGAVLHLYPVFGSGEVNNLSSPKLKVAFLNVVVSKITSGLFYQDALALGRLAETSALLGQGDAALEIFNYLIGSFMSNNLMFENSDHTNLGAAKQDDPFFNIGVNELLSATISSMLVSSSDHEIVLLPALPTMFEKGKIAGVYTKCSAVVDLSWDKSKGTIEVKIKANRSTSFNLVLPKGTTKIKNCEKDITSGMIDVAISAGKVEVFELKF